jgi:hypothetical protein
MHRFVSFNTFEVCLYCGPGISRFIIGGNGKIALKDPKAQRG